MLALPVQINRRRILVLILEKENVKRMELADPIDLKTKDYFVESVGADPVELLIAYEPDIEKFREVSTRGIAAVIEYLERGRTVYEGEPFTPKRWRPARDGGK